MKNSTNQRNHMLMVTVTLVWGGELLCHQHSQCHCCAKPGALWGGGMRSTQIIVTPIMHDILNLYISDYKMSLSTFLNTLTYCHKEMEETGRQPEKDKTVRNLLYLAILQYS